MKTTDIFKTKATKLNETFERTFGQKLKLDKFTIEQLEDARNRIRTQKSQVRTSSNFNETVENDAYTKAQWMLDGINAELAERFEETPVQTDPAQDMSVEGFDPDEFDGEFDWEGTGDDGESTPCTVYYIAKVVDGRPVVDPKSIEISCKEDPNSKLGFDSDMDLEMQDMDELMQAAQEDAEEQWAERDNKYAHGESAEDQGEEMSTVRESAADKASAIVVAKDMTDKVSRWIEELSGMENDTLLSLGDSIRDEMGQQEAKAYLEAVAPAISQALDNLKQTRETLASGMRALTGEEQPAEMIGSEPAEGGEEDMAEPAEVGAEEAPTEAPAEEPAGDEFAASEPAAGGAEEAGREKRESIERQNKLLKVLAG